MSELLRNTKVYNIKISTNYSGSNINYLELALEVLVEIIVKEKK